MSDKTSVLRGPKKMETKTRTVTRSMTSGTALATVPKGSRLIGAFFQGTASNAVTTGTVSFGNTATATEYGTANVLAAGIGNGGFFAFDATAQDVVTNETVIYAKYAETGGAATTGDWTVTLVYTTGNLLARDVI